MIIVQLTGGLGNQMFQYAFGAYLAAKHKTDLKLDTSFLLNRVPTDLTFYEYELGGFNIDAKILNANELPLYPPNRSVKSIPFYLLHLLKVRLKGMTFVKEIPFGFKEKYLKIKNNSYLQGYWQSEKFFLEIAEKIKKEFELGQPKTKEAQIMADKIQSCNAVCVHVRRGDYLKQIDHHGVVGNDYIMKADKIICSKIENPFYYVFSNDPDWCKNNLSFSGDFLFIDEINAGKLNRDHFKLMSLCKHFIIANSSFSWWAAWLGEKSNSIVISPKEWLQNKKIDTSSIVPDRWIKI